MLLAQAANLPSHLQSVLMQPVLMQAADPTGLSTPLGKVVLAAGLLVVIVVLVRQLREHRKR